MNEKEYRLRLIEKKKNAMKEKRKVAITKNEPVEKKSETGNQADTCAPVCHCPPDNNIFIGQMISSQIQQASPEATQMVTMGEEGYGKLNSHLIRRILEGAIGSVLAYFLLNKIASFLGYF